MSLLATVLLVVLIFALIGGYPSWPHGGFGYGYYPSGGAGLLLLIALLLVLVGRL